MGGGGVRLHNVHEMDKKSIYLNHKISQILFVHQFVYINFIDKLSCLGLVADVLTT